MTSFADHSDQKFNDLVSKLLDDDLGDIELKCLADLLQRDPHARQLYHNHIALHTILRWMDGGLTCNAAVPVSTNQRATVAVEDSEFVERTASHSIPSFLTTAFGYFSSGWPMAYLAATVFVSVGLLIGAMTHVSHPDKSVVSGQWPVASKSNLQSLTPNPSFVGRITGMVDCEFSDKSTLTFAGAHVSLGRKYALSSGLMEITYDTGAKVILHGPVTYVVESKNGGFMPVGRLTGKVEVAKARGFAIRTPTATVTDLGTEFGVEVDGKGETDAQVFVGEVQIAIAGDQPSSNKQPRVVRAGQNAHVAKELTLSADQRDFDARAKRFARTMPARSSTSGTYAELVLSMNPVVYYRMDQWPEADTKDRYVLVDSAPGGYHGESHVDINLGKPFSAGRFGGALDIRGSTLKQFNFVKDYPKTQNGQLSVSAWIWPITLDRWCGFVGNRYLPLSSEKGKPGYKLIGQFGFGISHKSELQANILQPDGRMATVCEKSVPLPRCKWHHVAFVADGAILHLYRNGVEVDAISYKGISRKPVRECLSIGGAINKDATGPRPENAYPWNGRIDEIAIFNHVLSAEQVRQLSADQAAALKGKAIP